MNSVLYDAWATCSGNWSRSTFLEQVRDRHRTTKRGIRKWITAKEMDERFGHELGAEVRNRKLLDPELCKREVRKHPELPDSEVWFIVDRYFAVHVKHEV